MIVPENTISPGCQCANPSINKVGGCICANCQCHIRRQPRAEYEQINLQYIACSFIFSFIVASALYILVIRDLL
jgi:hypothetical protein